MKLNLKQRIKIYSLGEQRSCIQYRNSKALRQFKVAQNTFQFRKFKVALKRMYRIFLNFAKSRILSCLSKFYNKKKFHRAVFEI